MDKKQAIRIITKAAKLYEENLEDQKVLFIYGISSEIRKQILGKEILSKIKSYEVVFYRYNFLHLAGVKISGANIKSAIHFYEKCLDNRLSENDFNFSRDGSTIQKLDILERMMLIKRNAMMIGDFADKGPKLYSEKIAGNVYGCVGFVEDKNTKLNVPNTVLKKDIRDVTAIPTQKKFAVISKRYAADKYSVMDKIDKSLDLRVCRFSDEIENLLDRGELELV